MSHVTKTALKELQRLDGEIRVAEKRAAAFGPLLDDVEGPALQLDTEAGVTRARFQEMKLDGRRHELAAVPQPGRGVQQRCRSIMDIPGGARPRAISQ